MKESKSFEEIKEATKDYLGNEGINMAEINDINGVYEVLDKCQPFYVATSVNGQPRTRPFGIANIYNDKLYIVTSNDKDVFNQMIDNPKISICGMVKKSGVWIRVEGEVVLDSSKEAKLSMIQSKEKYLRGFHGYSEDDGVMEVLYFKSATVNLSSYKEGNKTIEI